MKSVEIFAPAKLNLFFKILNKKIDGFHDVETIFEKISLCDRLVLREQPANKITIQSNSDFITSLGKKNLVYRALERVCQIRKIKKGVSVYLEKNIPSAAGLGGGSSDAAAALKGVDRLWRLGLTNKELIKISFEIGSDVALFVPKNRFLLGRGRGNTLSLLPVPKNFVLWHILIFPRNVSIATSYAYSLFDKYFFRRKCHKKSAYFDQKMKLTIPNYGASIITHALLNRDVSLLNHYSYNSFKDIVIHEFPQIARLKKKLDVHKIHSVHLSGSGPALFVTVAKKKEAVRLAKKAKTILRGCQCLLAHTF